jgi:hypothetical protein
MLRNLILALLLVASSAAGAEAPAPVLDVAGSTPALSLTRELLHRLPRVQIPAPANDHGPAASFEGVSLRDLLTEAKVPSGKEVRGKLLSWVVVVDAADGYRAVYALAELDPAFTDDRAFLVDMRDGKPLSSEEGPLRLVLPEEKRPARWIRQVSHIWVGPVDAAAPPQVASAAAKTEAHP